MTARTLVLLRHAKATSPDGASDVDRPLSERGHADAAAAGAWLRQHGHGPDLVICSPAKRTRQTWHGIAVALAATASPPVRYEPAVYHGSAEDLLHLVRDTADPVHTLLLVGHNPTLSQLAIHLDPGSTLDSDGLRTCGLSVHTVSGSWQDCGARQAPITVTHTARG